MYGVRAGETRHENNDVYYSSWGMFFKPKV